MRATRECFQSPKAIVAAAALATTTTNVLPASLARAATISMSTVAPAHAITARASKFILILLRALAKFEFL